MTQKFKQGELYSTPGVLATFSDADLARCLARHLAGDWGDLEQEDVAVNEESLVNGDRLISVYALSQGRLWIITEAEDDNNYRSATTLLLPDEY